MWGLGRWIGAVVFVVILGIAGWWFAAHWRPAVKDFPIQGVDVSAATGAVDWGTAKAEGADFAYVLATMGDRGRDPTFEGHWAALADSGIRRGAMHAYSLCRLAADQADHFNAVVPRMPDALPAVVAFDFAADCTDRPTREVLLREVATFLERVERHTGERVLIRVSPDFEKQYRLSDGLPRTFWATGNWFPPDYLARPWRMWQANAARRVEGFEAPVGWDVVAP
ncbi:MAG TPA: glycosyl hydrolase [Sphingomonas bacterium]|uniref:Glycosyl hydrolase n=1 Tax=Sphingomonas bacterium TaxID=1895847 RepID=A0A3D0WAL7_9SPHN|nr:glycosyl hydrolase [Sphingomonas bacterium]